MGIFDFTRPDNYSKISEEWQIFESVFPDTGAFKYLSSRKEAYLDDNTYRILRVKKETEDGSMPETDFFRLLRKITVEPVYNKRHIYNYRCGNESFWIKLCMIEKNGQWLGFVKDMTSMMQEITFSESFSILNSVTKLNSREAFLEELRILSEAKKIKKGCLATFHINGINHLNQILGVDNSKKCISCVARTVSHFMAEDIIIGSTPYYEFLVFFKNKSSEESIELIKQIADAVHESKVTDDFGEALIPGSDARLSLNCGYSTYPDDSEDFNKLVNYSGFALYEILENTTGMINKFNRKSYEKEKEFYTDAQIFCKIIDENLFEYHLQPIVDAKTGVVFGYEALMRTIGNKYLNPFQMLEIAKKQKRTYDIEKKTFFNVLKILRENIDMFKDKKLFINSIPDHMLTDEDFEELCVLYGDLMPKVVIEITEQSDVSNEFLEKLTKRREKTGLQIAFDDYGTGYSNTANLIRYNPDYIKIDRSLITNIDSDLKRRQLVTAVAEFAEENDITVLAEGIETSLELSTVIRLGVDLIQGYYTSRPKPFILYEISNEIKDEIVNVNARRNSSPQPFCVTVESEEELVLADVDCDAYTDIVVNREKVKLTGDNFVLKTGIITADDSETEITLSNVCISRDYGCPAITVGDHSKLTLIVEGENEFANIGINVPPSSELVLKGSGILKIISDEDNPYAIGNDYNSAYGSIIVDMTGKLIINVNGVKTVAIGGGSNPLNSIIKLLSGKITIQNTGKRCVSVGSIEGNALVEIGENCDIEIENSSIDSVSVGSFKNNVDIDSCGSIKIVGSGSNILGIGVLSNGTGKINIGGGNIDINFGAKNAFCIGTRNGKLDVNAENTAFVLSAGGVTVGGIGDDSGSGDVKLENNELKIRLNGENTMDIGSHDGVLVRNGNKIISRINC